jgi:hypothetical protein
MTAMHAPALRRERDRVRQSSGQYLPIQTTQRIAIATRRRNMKALEEPRRPQHHHRTVPMIDTIIPAALLLVMAGSFGTIVYLVVRQASRR